MNKRWIGKRAKRLEDEKKEAKNPKKGKKGG